MAITQDDFITPITGNIVIQNNGARLVLQSNADLNTLFEGDESFKLVLRKGSNTGPIVTTTPVIVIKDISNTRTYSIVTSPAGPSYLENTNIIVTINTTNYPDNTVLYFDTVGNVTQEFFVEGNTGSFTIMNSTANITLRGNINLGTDVEVDFKLRIKDAEDGNILFTGNTFNIIDTNLARIAATGGTVIDSGGFRTHIFTSSTDFNVTRVGVEPVNITYNIIAGGGGGGRGTAPVPEGTGGGAGGFLIGTYNMPTGGTGPYSVVVGGGGGGIPHTTNGAASQGSNSSIFGAIAVGGGAGVGGPISNLNPGAFNPRKAGGSGAGGFWARDAFGPNSPYIGPAGPGTPGQGFAGTTAPTGGFQYSWTGGSGAGGPGSSSTSSTSGPPRGGGPGIASPITVPASYGTPGPTPGRWFAGGGAGSAGSPQAPTPPYGGGGFGAGTYNQGDPGDPNTGGGGAALSGTANPPQSSGAGGSGIVIIRYPYTP